MAYTDSECKGLAHMNESLSNEQIMKHVIDAEDKIKELQYHIEWAYAILRGRELLKWVVLE